MTSTESEDTLKCLEGVETDEGRHCREQRADVACLTGRPNRILQRERREHRRRAGLRQRGREPSGLVGDELRQFELRVL